MYWPPDKHPPGSRIRLNIGLALNAGLLLVVNLLDVSLTVVLALFIGVATPYAAYVFWWQREQQRSANRGRAQDERSG
ncbi:Flp pilus assembly protein TadB [Saccharopolyspora lacisalsi]|uniref:Flp pilus assembly protein TadB n=1 Tax=Halosaccharopolyspora lacisalsi TaxID=1000566 RepID=A0A839DWM3_9PSEU|nr:hypothetical protein [Halosaccharopolyspora lacisalsi]MBA8825159.1 Flp pilus assembly protein TadB [Halosaccharopolyspora lacisalsi]